MPDLHVVDAFKFVAVRPPQLISERAAELHLIRDDRPVDGPRPPQQGVPPQQLEQLAEAARALADHFAAQAGDAPASVPDTHDLAIDEQTAAHLAGLAWDAVYSTYQEGPSAAPEMQSPVAALRLLHFLELRRRDAVGTAADAVNALTATPVVPPRLAVVEPPDNRVRASAQVPTKTDEAEIEARALLEEVAATRSLLDAVRAGSAGIKTRVSAEEPTMQGDLRRDRIVVGRIARLSDVRFTPASQTVATNLRLDDSTPLPTAATAVQRHLSDLLRTVNAQRDSPALRQAYKQLAGGLRLDDLDVIIPDLGPIWGDLTGDPSTAPDVDVSGRIRPLGIGDLKVVKQTLLAYQPGEVAHIENVLRGEHKERVHRTLDRTETTFFESSEESTETQRDSQSTDRFELKKEADSTIKEDMSLQAGVTVTASFGPVVTTAHGDFAYSTSKQESAKSSSNFAREVVEKSVSKIQKKVRTERTTKTFREVEETNTHGIDNKGQPDHVTGVYRWVDKRYRAQIYNYGRRLMLEFVVPQPAAYWLASQIRKPGPVDAVEPAPFVNSKDEPLSARDITEANYQILAARWNAAGITPPPREWVYVTCSFEQGGVENGKTVAKTAKDLVVPEGYTLIYYLANVSVIYVVGGPRFSVHIGDDAVELVGSTAVKQGRVVELGWAADPGTWDNPQGAVSVACIGYDVNAYAVTVGANCQRNPSHLEDWQNKTYEKIYAGYLAMKTAYDQKVAQAEARDMGVQIQGRNPLQNREIERRELKKLCVTMMSGNHLAGFNAMTDPSDPPRHIPEVDVYEALAEGPVIQFFEQAFDWAQLTYLFYPYFWDRKSKWVKASNESDPDPLFAQFLQAGAARVVIPVSPAYNQAVAYFLAKKSPKLSDRIWLGGESPTIDDPLYKSIADEMRAQTDDLAGATPEGTPWEFTVPTTLVWLQPDSELPTFPA